MTSDVSSNFLLLIVNLSLTYSFILPLTSDFSSNFLLLIVNLSLTYSFILPLTSDFSSNLLQLILKLSLTYDASFQLLHYLFRRLLGLFNGTSRWPPMHSDAIVVAIVKWLGVGRLRSFVSPRPSLFFDKGKLLSYVDQTPAKESNWAKMAEYTGAVGRY